MVQVHWFIELDLITVCKFHFHFSHALGNIVSFNPAKCSINFACNDALYDVQNRCTLTTVSTLFYPIINIYYLDGVPRDQHGRLSDFSSSLSLAIFDPINEYFLCLNSSERTDHPLRQVAALRTKKEQEPRLTKHWKRPTRWKPCKPKWTQ